MSKPHILIIIGTTRDGRVSEPIARWFKSVTDAEPAATFEIVDLKDWSLPFFNAPSPQMGRYTSDIQTRWGAKIASADGYVVVTAEYNHGYPADLKNALDYVYHEWGYKPMTFLSYGNAGGARAVEQLRQVAVELNAVPIRNQVAINVRPTTLIDEHGAFDGTQFEGAARRTLEQLLWWATALQPAREGRTQQPQVKQAA